MPRRRRATRKKGSGGWRPRPRRRRRRMPRSIGGVDGYHSSSDEDYVAAEDGGGDESESSDEPAVSPRGSSDEECFEFSDSSGEEEEAAASKRRATRGKARKRPRVSNGVSQPRRKSSAWDPDDDDDDDEDEDFLLDEEYEEEKSPVAAKKRKIERKRKPSKPDEIKSKRKSTNSASAAPVRKRRRKIASLSDDDEDFIVEDSASKQRKKAGRRKKMVVDAESSNFIVSDDDSVAKDQSDSDFIVSDKDSISRGRLRNKRGTIGKKNAASKTGMKMRLVDSDLLNFDLDEDLRDLGSSTPQKKRIGKGGKGKEKVEEKGKGKVQDVSEKQVCGICLSEEQKATVRGVLNCCTHYYCFACIMEWSKVESRCPICKGRFTTISKPTGLSSGLGPRKAVVRVQKKNQVYQPSEEEIRGFIDPYENVVCIVCQEGGHDNLMLLCDICDSSAHTYCVGLGRTVPEGNWYCDGCMAVDNETSNSQVQDGVTDQGTSSNDFFSAGAETEDLSTVMRSNTDSQQKDFVCLRGSSQIELNVSPRNIQMEDNGVARQVSGSRVSVPSVSHMLNQRHFLSSDSGLRQPEDNGVACQASGSRVSVPSVSHTLNQRHFLSSDSGLRQPEDLFSRTLNSPVQNTAVGQGTSSSNLFSSGIKLQDTGTDMHTTTSSWSSLTFPGQFSSQRIDLNASSRHLSRESHGVASQTSGFGASTLSGRRAIHRHIHNLLSNSRPRQTDVPRRNLENDVTSEIEPRRQPLHTSEALNPFQTVSATNRQMHNSRHILQANENLARYMFSEGVSLRQVEGAKEQVQSTVKRHLTNFSRDISLDRESFKDIARRSTHTILAACGIEHNRRMVATSIQPPGNCCHDRDVKQTDMVKDCCSSCFNSFVRDVVHNVMNATC